MEIFGFERLRVYERAHSIVVDVYALLKNFPAEEKYALCDQMRRSAISVPSNIAEGMGRCSLREQAHFLEIAYGSLMELYSQLRIALDLHYISDEAFCELKRNIYDVATMLSKLHAIRQNRIENKHLES